MLLSEYIPDNCHFFYTDTIFGAEILHPNARMSQLLLLGKFEYGGGPIFKVVLEC